MSERLAIEKPYLCPVCEGCGWVPPDFYTRFGSATSLANETCRACRGAGIVWSRLTQARQELAGEPASFLEGEDTDEHPIPGIGGAETCETCQGEGSWPERECPTCHGTGDVPPPAVTDERKESDARASAPLLRATEPDPPQAVTDTEPRAGTGGPTVTEESAGRGDLPVGDFYYRTVARLLEQAAEEVGVLGNVANCAEEAAGYAEQARDEAIARAERAYVEGNEWGLRFSQRRAEAAEHERDELRAAIERHRKVTEGPGPWLGERYDRELWSVLDALPGESEE